MQAAARTRNLIVGGLRLTELRFDLLRDRVKVRPFAGFQFGVNEFTIDVNFKGTAAGRDQLGFHARRFLNDSGQPGRFRFVVSVGAVLDRYFWLQACLLFFLTLFVPAILSRPGRLPLRILPTEICERVRAIG